MKTQRELMKKKRQPKNVEKTDSQNANLDSGNRPKKKRNLLQHYQKLKKDLLANEEQFGFKGLYLVEGIDIHEENFEQLIIEKIKERK
ncbi:hypothetical protein Javan425_0026 [Streptococcus phage Javan425]|nr:hypothetical protein Javan425_0026 [Streptococcus phage Javan425]